VPLKWTDLAVADLDKIEDHISAKTNPNGAADTVLKLINTVGEALPSHPKGGREGRVSGTRELLVDNIPFVVVYRESNADGLPILRILRDEQQWPQAI